MTTVWADDPNHVIDEDYAPKLTTACVVAHSRPSWAVDGSTDLISLELRYPRIILAELNTHRVFSRSTQSSRAVPVRRMFDLTLGAPFVPSFAANRPGMQAGAALSVEGQAEAGQIWMRALRHCLSAAEGLALLGVHKQWVSRLMEPWAYVSTIVTATEWDNFFTLRDHPDAQPEMQALARAMRAAIRASTPKILDPGEWHLPYVLESDREAGVPADDLRKISTARCARVSFLRHDGSAPSVSHDLERYHQLLTDRHLSPFEHQGTPMLETSSVNAPGVTHLDRQGIPWSANFRWWLQHRHWVL